MDHTIVYAKEAESKRLLEGIHNQKEVWVVEVQGEDIHSEEEFVYTMSQKFRFPKMETYKMGWYIDYISDLNWIEQRRIAIVFHNFDKMLEDNPKLKELIVKDYEEIIIPWWNGEVEKCMVGGKTREFTVYFLRS